MMKLRLFCFFLLLLTHIVFAEPLGVKNTITGNLSIGSGASDSLNVSISLTNTSRSFLLFTQSFTRGDSYSGNIINSTLLQFVNNSYGAPAGDRNEIHYFVPEFDSGIRVLRGNVTVNDGIQTAIVDLNTTINLSKAFVLFSLDNNRNNIFTDDDRLKYFANFTNSSNIQFSRNDTLGRNNIQWQVVEFLDDSTVQYGTTNLSDTTRSVLVNIGSVDLTKSFIVFSFNSTNTQGREANFTVRANFTDSNTLQFTRFDAFANTRIDISWFVISINSTGATVQSRTVNLTSSNEDNFTINEVDLSRSVIIMSNECELSGQDVALSCNPTVNFSNSTQVRIYSSSITQSNALATFFVIEFPTDGSGPTITNAAINQTFLGGVRNINISATLTDTSNVSHALVEIINPGGALNETNRTMTRSGTTDVYYFEYTTNTTEGNWTVWIGGNDTYGNNATRTQLSFVIDTTYPIPSISRTSSMDGVIRGVNVTNIIVNHSDVNVANWSLFVIYPNGTLRTTFNGTLNSTLQFNSTATDPPGNWTINLTATDQAGNTNTTEGWFGLGNFSILTEFRWESGNFSTPDTAWGNSSALANDTITDHDYMRVVRIAWDGICTNCSVSVEYNISTNFTAGGFSIISMVSNANSTINYTVDGGNLINFTYDMNVTNTTNSTNEDVRLRVTVPSALWFQLRPDSDGVLWYSVSPRNVSNGVNPALYLRVATTSSHTFDSASQHPRYNFCDSGANGTAVPPTCTTLGSAVDVNDGNNGNNGDINLYFDGPTNARNIRRFMASFSSDFLFRETIEGGGTSGESPSSGGGGGGGGSVIIQPAPPPVEQAVTPQVQQEIPPPGNVAVGIMILIVAGIVLIAANQRNVSKRKASARRRDSLGL